MLIHIFLILNPSFINNTIRKKQSNWISECTYYLLWLLGSKLKYLPNYPSSLAHNQQLLIMTYRKIYFVIFVVY